MTTAKPITTTANSRVAETHTHLVYLRAQDHKRKVPGLSVSYVPGKRNNTIEVIWPRIRANKINMVAVDITLQLEVSTETGRVEALFVVDRGPLSSDYVTGMRDAELRAAIREMIAARNLDPAIAESYVEFLDSLIPPTRIEVTA